jgi:hypothetical protein
MVLPPLPHRLAEPQSVQESERFVILGTRPGIGLFVLNPGHKSNPLL